MPLIPELEAELTAAIERRSPSPNEPSRGWRRVRRLAPLSAVLVVSTAAALAATGVIPIGSPVPEPDHPQNPHRGAGALVPGTTKVLALRVADPDGGPDWGMRVQATTRNALCIQAARVLDGRLGVLGQDGAFNNDGRFHPLPARTGSLGCGALGPHGDGSFSISMNAVPASGATGGFLGVDLPRCQPANCPKRDLRNVYAGLLGRDAQSVTYEDDNGHEHTMPAIAPYGAYLIVRRATAEHGSSIGFGPYPPSEVVRKITFRDGTTCTFPKPAVGARTPPCAGLAPTSPSYTHAQLATPISATAHRRGRYWTITVRFRARAAIATAAQAYTIKLSTPNTKHMAYALAATQHDIAANTIVTQKFGYKTHSGVYTGEVRLATTTTAGMFPTGNGVLVGRFKVRIP